MGSTVSLDGTSRVLRRYRCARTEPGPEHLHTRRLHLFLCLPTDGYCPLFVLFPQTNALSVKSQDVDILGSIFSWKAEQTENAEGTGTRNRKRGERERENGAVR